MNAIEINNLRRVFQTNTGTFRRKMKEVVAVEDVSFDIKAGELFGLLGPNGAGKTTIIKMLTTLLIPTKGNASILGLDIIKDANAIRSKIGFIFGGERGLYWRLSAVNNLRYFASLYHVEPRDANKRIPYLLDLVGLEGRGDEKVEGYSRGMKQRLHIARALLHEPDVLFLDEPTIGLDPVGARELRSVVRNLQSQKKTILLTTHYMFEADALCERIAVINHGNIIALDTPEALKKHVQDLSVIEIEVYGIEDEIVNKIKDLPYVDNVSTQDRGQSQMLMVQTPRGPEAVADLVSILNGTRIGKVSAREPTLEDAYVRLVEGAG